MQLIRGHLHGFDSAKRIVPLRVDRHTLARRRWRGAADDGSEFGFELEHPLHDEDVFAETSVSAYRIAQSPESVLEVALDSDPSRAAWLGWTVGNLHFQMQPLRNAFRVADDPALRQLFNREGIHFHVIEAVFSPASGGHSHGHSHA